MRIYQSMSDFSACTVSPCYNPLVDNNSTAYTSSESCHNQIFCTFSAAFPHFTKSSYICVISCLYCHSCQFLQFFLNILSAPVKINSTCNLSVFFNWSRQSNTNALYLCFFYLFFFHLCCNSICNIWKNSLTAIVCICFDFPFIQNSSII